ncbi:MAG: site-specific integrase [Candidatus Nanoarchaeia archaeon]|jgi:site-specific recombinase XerD
MDELDIHDRRKRYEKTVKNIEKDKNLTTKNKEFLLKLKDDLFAFGLSLDRVLFYLHRLKRMGKWLNMDFDKATIDDLKRLIVEHVENGRVPSTGKSYTENTKRDFKRSLKSFYKWIAEIPWTEMNYPDKVKWINIGLKQCKARLPDDLLSKEDINKMIAHSGNLRDKAMISTLYEGGFRIGELLNIKLRDLSFTEYGVKVIVSGKTGMRTDLLINSTQLLATWIENHPLRDKRDSYLWITMSTNNKGKGMKYGGVAKRFKEIAKLSEIQKDVNPHNFRHSRASELANKLTEAQMCNYFGWRLGSKMPAIYVHLSGRDIDDAILKMHGLKKHEEELEFTEIKCPRCNQKNNSASKYCSYCGLLVDEKEAITMVKVGNDMIPYSAIQEMIKAEIQRMK